MKQAWLKTSIAIASIFSFRMLGLFMLIPVFTIYARDFKGATPASIGIALGAYGLTQGILQIPYGILSDKFGRKTIITIGLIIFIIGSIIGANSNSIQGLICARTLQGSGAIGSVLIALLSDLTPDNKRAQSMAIIGSSIGVSFSLAIILSPYISKYFALAGIFYTTTALAILGLIILHIIIPTPVPNQPLKQKINFKEVLLNPNLIPLNIGIFIQHLLLTSTFYVLPLLLEEQIRSSNLHSLWGFYLPIVLISFLLIIPCIMITERKQKVKFAFNLSIIIILISQICLTIACRNFVILCIFTFLYFIAFNFLEANLPALISKKIPMHKRGSAMGIYSSSQFLGIFIGGVLSGYIFNWLGARGIFITNSLVTIIWLYLTLLRPNS